MNVTHPKPDLSDDKILRFVFGIRPCRTGGLRLETERVSGSRIIHNYGHGGCGVTLAMGCAWAVAERAREAGAKPGSAVAVLGGGVTGLASALSLLEAGYEVSVHAEAFAGETTSNVAGALWLPTGLDFPEPGPKRDELNGLLRRSLEMLRGLDAEAWGVRELPVFEPDFAEHHAEFFESGAIEGPRAWAVTDGEIPGMTGGRVFTTMFIDTPRFIRRLHDEVVSRGGKLVKQKLGTLDDITSIGAPVVVNCLAMGSRELFGDEAIYPARGLLVHMQPQDIGYIYHDSYNYMFPRSDALILGGTFEPGVTEPPETDEPYLQILESHRARYSD